MTLAFISPEIEVRAEQPHLAAPWMHVVSHLDPKYGGLSSVVPQLCSSLSGLERNSANLAAFCLPGENFELPASIGLQVSYWPTGRMKWMFGGDLRGQFAKAAGAAEGLHIHGLWEQSTAVAARTARSLGKPYVVSAHGMLDPWALANKKWKKLFYAALFEHSTVAGAACLHALTAAEAQNYRDFGSRAPIAIIPNGVNVPPERDPQAFFARYPDLRGKRIILFLGRIHFKKGLDLLIRAWATLAAKWPEARLVLAGPDSENTRARLEPLLHESGLAREVLFTGMLEGEMKWSALAAAECFVLPSYSEGLSTSVLEAMGFGLPVIVTRECNIPEVELYKTGWQIQSNVDELSFSLKQVLENSTEANKAIGARGTRLVHEHYGWTSVARRMAEVYRWISGGPEPHSTEILSRRSI